MASPELGTSKSASKLVRRASNAARHMISPSKPSPPQVQDAATISSHVAGSASATALPSYLITGVPMLKVSAKKRSQRLVKLLPEEGQIAWQSNSLKNALLSDSGWSFLSLERILELRFGEEASSFIDQFAIASEVGKRWMTIIYFVQDGSERRVKMLHLVAMQQEVADAWRNILTSFTQERKALMASHHGDHSENSKRWHTWLMQCWHLTDSDHDQRVNLAEVISLCRRLGISVTEDQLRDKFAAADTNHHGYLNLDEFQAFVRLLRRRSEIAALVKAKSTSTADRLSPEAFLSFLQQEQGETAKSSAELMQIYQKYALKQPDLGMTVEEFTTYLASADNAPFGSSFSAVTQNMTRPLCEYYISSSHNTYLVGNQLKGDSTTEGYVRALQQGCRCVELDVWNGPNGQPVIYHGRTLTTKITFQSVIEAIKKYAFVSSPYPVILSIEMHCDTAQQAVMARILLEVLGSALLSAPLPTHGDDVMPSPDQLKHRFLLKAKNLLEATPDQGVKDRKLHMDPSSMSESTEASTSATAESSDNEIVRRFDNVMKRFKGDNRASDLGRSASPASTSPAPAKKVDMSPEFASLIVYTIGVKCRGFNKKEVYHPFQVMSLGERRLTKTMKEAKSDLMDHNRSHIVRSYPASFRFTSSNYLPHTLWAVGISMVAINWQTFDLGAQINAAFFRRNGGCGYVLKPDVLRKKHPLLKDKDILANPRKFVLHIEIISGQQLLRSLIKPDAPLPPSVQHFSPFVELAVFAPGVEASQVPRQKTSPVVGNGFNPIFPDNTFEIRFEVVDGMLELVFLQLLVFDDSNIDNGSIAQCCLSLGDLRPGYRHVPLFDQVGQEYLFSSLFIKSSCNAINS